MKSLAPLLFLLFIGMACTKTVQKSVDGSSPTENVPQESSAGKPTPMDEVSPMAKETNGGKEVPSAFSGIDFKNFSYPTNLRGKVTLENGTREYENPEGGGDTFWFRNIYFADLTGDGEEEAIVRLVVASCGVSCDGGSSLFYFYSAARNKPRLLSRIETGSAAYGECALKSFVLNKRALTLELFRICRVRGLSFQSSSDLNATVGKYAAHSFTQFHFQFNGRSFVLKKREVFPFPPGDINNYEETVSVNIN